MALSQKQKLTPFLLFMTCMPTFSSKSSCVAIHTRLVSKPAQEQANPVSAHNTFKELVKAGEYERALLLLDPVTMHLRGLDDSALDTQNIPFILAFVKKVGRHPSKTWDSLFHCAALRGWIQICEALWPLRHYSQNPSYPIELLVEMITHASVQNDIPFIMWGLETLKALNSLNELNRVKGGYTNLWYDLENPPEEPICYKSALIAASDNNKRKIVSILLMHGADPEVVGYTGASSARACAGWKGYKDIDRHLMAFINSKPLILDFIKQPSVQDRQQKALAALLQCKELTSEYILDQRGNTILHGAVLSKNRKLILLCLVHNPGLIDARNGDGFTAFQLAFGKGFFETLCTMLDFCYAQQ